MAIGFGVIALLGAAWVAALSFAPGTSGFNPSESWRMAGSFLLPLGALGVLGAWAVGRKEEPKILMRIGVVLALLALAALVVMQIAVDY